MKKVLYATLAMIVLFTYSCTKEESKEKELLTNANYKKMSLSEKILFEDQIVQKLKADPNFIKFDNSVQKLVSLQIESHQKKKPSLTRQQIAESYTDPNYNDEITKVRREVFENLILLRKSAPELKVLDRLTRKAVFNQASKNRTTN